MGTASGAPTPGCFWPQIVVQYRRILDARGGPLICTTCTRFKGLQGPRLQGRPNGGVARRRKQKGAHSRSYCSPRGSRVNSWLRIEMRWQVQSRRAAVKRAGDITVIACKHAFGGLSGVSPRWCKSVSSDFGSSGGPPRATMAVGWAGWSPCAALV